MSISSSNPQITNWIFFSVMVIISILNIILVHVVPGLVYMAFALIFFQPTNQFLRRKLNFSIPFAFQIILFVLIMWATLGVGDLAEILGL